MKISVISDCPSLEKYVQPWKELHDSLESQGIYQNPLWHLAWWRTLGKNKSMQIVAMDSDGQTVGIIPFSISRSTIQNGNVRILEFSGSTQGDQNDIIILPDFASEGINLFNQIFSNLLKKVDVSSLHSLPSTSILITESTLSKFKSTTYPQKSPYLPLSGKSFDQILRDCSRSHRGDIRRQWRRMDEVGDLRLTVVEKQQEIFGMFEQFMKAHSTRWGIPVYKNNPYFQGFYKELIRLLWPAGNIHFSVLTLNDQPISFHFGFQYRNQFYYLKPAYDKNFSNYSPGKVHIAELIKSSVESGLEEFNFLLGDEAYKFAWTSTARTSASFFIRGNGLLSRPGYWWLNKGKSLVSGSK